MKINLGSGKRKREGWLNVDIRPHHEPDVVLDLREPWPWPDDSVDAIESYHLIEHLPLGEARKMLVKAWRALRPGGTIAIECPDLAGVCDLFFSDPERAVLSMYGRQDRGPSMRHQYGYTRESLATMLEEVGFTVTATGDGTDYHAAEEPCLRVEAVK